jgi:hypothetical protein
MLSGGGQNRGMAAALTDQTNRAAGAQTGGRDPFYSGVLHGAKWAIGSVRRTGT